MLPGCAEEDEVAGLEVAALDRRAVARGELRVGDARDLDAGLRVGPLHEAGAVEARLRRRAAPLVRGARVLLRLLERRERLRAGAAATAGRCRRGVGGRGGRGGCRGGGLLDGRGRRGAGAAEQRRWPRRGAAVAAAVLRGGALDVRDPLAELLRVGDRLAARDALLLDRLGLVEEPLDLQLGLLGEALVGALVPDPDAHLEEADGVGVAVVEVLDAGLDERRHHRQLLREPALLGLPAHPRGELRLRRVVARVAARAAGAVGGRGGGVGHARAARRGAAGGGGRGARPARRRRCG